MDFVKPANAIIFAEEKVEDAFNSLSADAPLKKSILKAISDLNQNAFCGEKIKKQLIPKEYIKKYNLKNLYWHKLSKDWRLVYSIFADQVEILALIIEYFDHKNYKRRFNY